MNASPLVRRQLFIFAAVAFVAVLTVSLSYLQVPRMLGIGQMHATAELPTTGGLAANARVTYRGVEVGRVTAVDLADTGVRARLTLERDADLPADVKGQVHSSSVIGEQYLELLPTGETTDGETKAQPRRTAAKLVSGATIPPARKPVPVDAGTLLTTVDNLIRSVDSGNLKIMVDELDTAFEGSREPLSKMLDGSNDLVSDAQADLDQTRALIANLEPVLKTQVALAPKTKKLAATLADVTGQLEVSDADLRSLIDQTPAAADQITQTVTAVHPMLPQVLANLASTGQVLRIYLPGLKQVLTIYPAIVAQLQAIPLSAELKGRSNMFFHVNINDPAPCRQGFTGAHRAADDTSPTPKMDNGWCKLPQNADTNVRGSRNNPCPNSGARSATAAGCGLDFTKPPKATLTSYDPGTGAFTGPDGRMYTIDLKAKGRSGSPYASGLLRALSSP